MTNSFVLAAVLGFAGLGAQAQTAVTPAPDAPAATEEQTLAIAVAIAANGCRVTAENNSTILAEAGLAEADAATVVQALLDAGSAEIKDGELVLVSEACPAK